MTQSTEYRVLFGTTIWAGVVVMAAAGEAAAVTSSAPSIAVTSTTRSVALCPPRRRVGRQASSGVDAPVRASVLSVILLPTIGLPSSGHEIRAFATPPA